MTCSSCGAANADGEALCTTCGFLLAEDGGGRGPDARGGVAATPGPPGSPPGTCPACAAEIPDPGNLVCVECLEPLPRKATPASPLKTRREEAARSLRLLFDGQPVEVPRTGLLLGRDPTQSPVAAQFAALDNVSRRHASIGVDADGTVWVRDEHSANGTYVNDTPVPGGRTRPLVDGDLLRLASDVVARVELR